MNMFNHITTALPELTTETINRKRFYVTPEGEKYPSITTVLSNRKKEGLFEWRKRVGNDVANYVARTSAARGTKVHHMCEDYLNNEFDEEKHRKDFLPFCLFNQLKDQVLCNLNNIYAQEAGLYSDKYRVAGRVDCIAEYKNTLSIIDFKTSSRERNDDWNENYYIQTAAYAEMFQERTGLKTDQIVILVVTEDGTVQEFVKNKQDYLPMLEESMNEWSKSNETSSNIYAGDVSSSRLSDNAIG
tara:strand:- start:55 stop:786 length:732 start_codon:yes stop_codon:yes gene_type:complete